MRGNTRPGEGETFAEYFDGDHPGVLVREGEHEGCQYRLYKMRRRSRTGNRVYSHYAGYIRVPQAPCEHTLQKREIPHPPGHHGMNFGPTSDGWIGFGTLDDRDYNFHADMRPFDGDRRTPPEAMFEEDEPSYYTPPVLLDEVINWIDGILKVLDERPGCIVCDNH